MPRPSAPKTDPEGAVPADPFLHPDAQRGFRIVNSEQGLRQSLTRAWSRSNIVPDRKGVEKGIRLFKYLAESANQGQALGVSYVGFIEYLHGIDKFAALTGRNYLPSDSGIVVRIALSITAEAGGRQEVTRAGTVIRAGMDTFIWSKHRPFDRPLLAWKNYPAQPPYSREAWLSVFPHGVRRLLKVSELTRIPASS